MKFKAICNRICIFEKILDFIMIIRLIFCFSLFPLFSFSQKTLKIHDKETNERYSVLASDNNIKHGLYRKYSSRKLSVKGFYKQGLKDSLWIEYNYDIIASKGKYKNDKRIGVWEFYDGNEILHKFDYDSDSLIYRRESIVPNTKLDKIYWNGDSIKVILDYPVTYLGGWGAMVNFVQENIDIKVMNEADFSDLVEISFQIDENGKMQDCKINKKGNLSSVDKEALRVFKLASKNFIPAQYKGKWVSTRVILPLVFADQF